MNWLNCKLDSTFTGSLIKSENVGRSVLAGCHLFLHAFMHCMYIYTHYKRYMLNAYIDLHIYILIHLIYIHISALYIYILDVVKCILFNAHTLIVHIYIHIYIMCIYIYMYIYTYIYIYIHIYTYIYIYIHIYMYTYMIFIYNIIDMYMIAQIQIYHICICIYTHIILQICIDVHPLHIYIYIHVLYIYICTSRNYQHLILCTKNRSKNMSNLMWHSMYHVSQENTSWELHQRDWSH